MVSAQRDSWEQIANLAEVTRVPVVFVVHDIEALPGSLALAEFLSELASRHSEVYSVRFGPDAFGLGYDNPDELRRVVRSQLRLARDPHANATQHELIAVAVRKYLEESGVLTRVRRRANGS